MLINSEKYFISMKAFNNSVLKTLTIYIGFSWIQIQIQIQVYLFNIQKIPWKFEISQ